MARVAFLAAAVVLLAPSSQAYYHYVYYLSHSSPYTAVPAAFDLNVLPNKTVTFFASDAGPAKYGTNDTFGSVLSQVKQAAATWNSVASSDLRVAFGGLQSLGQTSNQPGGDVTFVDLPPGLLGLGGVTMPQTLTVSTQPGGQQIVPIARGKVILTNDTGSTPGPSYYESFYTTAVHEFGHALGLQHTWSGSAMSQDVIRNTSRARPLDADDMAAVSTLYGPAGWDANYGAVSGRVTLGSQPVAMASVVAISPTGPAVSALTDPDGNYSIQGLPPNTYMLYVHPLPPDAIPANGTGLVLPSDLSGTAFPATSGYFGTVFYPGTTDTSAASTFTVTAGKALADNTFRDRNFSVTARSSLPAYNLVTQSYLNTNVGTYLYSTGNGDTFVTVTPAYEDLKNSQGYLMLTAYANSGDTELPMYAQILGGDIPMDSPGKWGSELLLYFRIPTALPATGPRHLVFIYANDIYVLPAGINLVQQGPPRVSSVTQNGDGTVAIAGTNLGSGSRIFFDGLEAAESAFVGTAALGSITVTPPVGASGQAAAITAFNPDGQNSMFWQATPPTYSYAATATPQVGTISVTSLPISSIGTSAMVDVKGVNTNFVDGQVTLGFGTDDVSVRRVWVLSPTHLYANMVVAPNAATGSSEVSVSSGFQVASQPSAFQVAAANSALPVIALPVWNGSTLGTQLFPGTVATIYGINLAESTASLQLTVNNVAAKTTYVSANQINFVIPQSTSVGPAVLKLNNGSANANPVVLQIDGPAPVITGVTSAANTAVDSTHSAGAGDSVSVSVSGLDASVAANPGRLRVTVSGVPMTVQQVTAGAGGAYQVQFTLCQSFGGSLAPLVVSLDGSASNSYAILAR